LWEHLDDSVRSGRRVPSKKGFPLTWSRILEGHADVDLAYGMKNGDTEGKRAKQSRAESFAFMTLLSSVVSPFYRNKKFSEQSSGTFSTTSTSFSSLVGTCINSSLGAIRLILDRRIMFLSNSSPLDRSLQVWGARSSLQYQVGDLLHRSSLFHPDLSFIVGEIIVYDIRHTTRTPTG
jgi:hypothetical protein